jgi:hypothetical protein
MRSFLRVLLLQFPRSIKGDEEDEEEEEEEEEEEADINVEKLPDILCV